MSDAVNHPEHYASHPSGVECIDVFEHMTFNVGNAIKYLWRAGLKGDVIEDLKKARWYVNREIQRLESHRVSAPATCEPSPPVGADQPLVIYHDPSQDQVGFRLPPEGKAST